MTNKNLTCHCCGHSGEDVHYWGLSEGHVCDDIKACSERMVQKVQDDAMKSESVIR